MGIQVAFFKIAATFLFGLLFCATAGLLVDEGRAITVVKWIAATCLTGAALSLIALVWSA